MRRLLRAAAVIAAGSVCLATAAPQPPTEALRPWGDRYRVVLWCGENLSRPHVDTNALAAACRELGVTTLLTPPEGDPSRWLGAGFDYYVENLVHAGLCLKYRSPVTDWSAFIARWCADRSAADFERCYSLHDPAWRGLARREAAQTAARHAPFAPVLYDLRDELSTTVSANPFDYDFSPSSLNAFRAWLRRRYATLDALNAAWLTAFRGWDDVVPFSTDQIKSRTASPSGAHSGRPDWAAVRAVRFSPEAVRREPARWHLAPWCDFRAFMDDSLCDALTDLRAAVHAEDPATPVGIEGTQMPSAWGGYDLWKLSRVLDWVEPYDIAAARAVWGSFMAGKPILATYGERDPVAASRRLWHRLLEGDCGAILWWSEDLLEGEGAHLRLSAKGRALAPVFREMHAPLARLLLRAERLRDPIAVHYSQASIQLAWLFESAADGATWPRRFSSYEASHSGHAALRAELWRRLQEAGWSPQFVSYSETEQDALLKRGFTACLLPDSVALSDEEVTALRRFASSGRLLLYTGEPGVFCANGTPRTAPCFEASDLSARQLVSQLPPPPVRIETPDSGVVLYRYRVGHDLLFALEQRQEGQAGEDVTQAARADGAAPLRVTLAYADPRPLYDLRTGAAVGASGRASVVVPVERPTLLGFASSPKAP